MIIIRIEPLRVRPGMTAADLVRQARWTQRALWVGYVFSLAVFCGVVWQVRSVFGGAAPQMWGAAGTRIYGAAAMMALGALWLRHLAYAQANKVRPAMRRLSVGAGPGAAAFEATTVSPGWRGMDGPSIAAAHESGEQDLPALRLLAGALNGLMTRERLIWTLCAGPILLVVPALLSAGAAPVAPLPVASLALLLVTFPQTERFARAAGALPGHATAAANDANKSPVRP
jgi:hypothetical protein